MNSALRVGRLSKRCEIMRLTSEDFPDLGGPHTVQRTSAIVDYSGTVFLQNTAVCPVGLPKRGQEKLSGGGTVWRVQ